MASISQETLPLSRQEEVYYLERPRCLTSPWPPSLTPYPLLDSQMLLFPIPQPSFPLIWNSPWVTSLLQGRSDIYTPPVLGYLPSMSLAQRLSLRSPSVFTIAWQTCVPWVGVQQAPQRTTKMNSSWTELNSSSSHPQLKPWIHLDRLVFISYT